MKQKMIVVSNDVAFGNMFTTTVCTDVYAVEYIRIPGEMQLPVAADESGVTIIDAESILRFSGNTNFVNKLPFPKILFCPADIPFDLRLLQPIHFDYCFAKTYNINDLLPVLKGISRTRILEKKSGIAHHCFHSLCESDYIGLLVFDENKQCAHINTKMCKMLARTEDELISSRFEEIFSGDPGSGNFLRLLAAFGNREKLEDMEHILTGGEQPYKLISISLFPVKGSSDVTGNTLVLVKEIDTQEDENGTPLLYSTPLSAYMNNAPNSILLFDEKFTFVEGNASFLEVLGYSSEELAGKNLITLLVNTDPQVLEHSRTELIEKGRISKELLVRTKDGSLRNVSFDAVKINNKPARFMGFVKDITVIKQTENTILELSSRLSALLENIGTGILMEDENRQVVYTNKMFLEMFNIPIPAEKLIGFDCVLLVEMSKNAFVNPELFIAGISDIVYQKKKVVNDELILADGRVLERDYSPVYEGVSFSGHLWIYRNITDKKTAEEQLKSEQFKFETFANFTSDWEYWLLPDGHLEYISPSCKEITGYSAREFLENPGLIYDIIHEKDKPLVRNHLAEVRTNQSNHEQEQIEFRIISKIGLVRSLAHTCRTVYSRDGLFLGRRVSNRDISDKKISENYLRHSEAFMKGIYDGARIPILVIDIEDAVTFSLAGFNETFKKRFAVPDNTEMFEPIEGFWNCTTMTQESVLLLSDKLKLAAANNDCAGFVIASVVHQITSYWQTGISPLYKEDMMVYRLVITFLDITEQKIAREALALEVEINNCFQEAQNITDVYSRLLDIVISFSGMDSGGIYLFTKSPSRLDLVAHKGLSSGFISAVSNLDEVNRQYKIAAKLKKPALIQGGNHLLENELYVKENLQCLCIIPLHFKEENIGVVNLASHAKTIMNPRVYKTLMGISNQITSNLLKMRAEESLKESEERYKTLLGSAPAAIILLKDGIYTFANNTAAQYLGFGSGAEIIGQDFFADIIAHDHGHVKERINAAVKGKTEEVFEIPMMQPGGEILYLQAVALPLTVNGDNSILIIGTDITDRKHAEVRALASLREKETLLKEIHHRVKNNLQIISSLLNLQSEYIVGDDAKHAFVESLSRIRSMALIHERLYQTKDFSRIEISEYINDLVHFLVRTFNTRNVAINLCVDVDNIFLNLDTAMPIGLIINELVSNAFKYAYIGRAKGSLQISCKVTGTDRLLLDVADDGVGFPDAINFKDTMSLGFQLVCSLVEQLRGDIAIDKSNGTRFTINCSVL